MKTRPKVLFMGTPEYAKTILAQIYKSDFDICCVISQPNKKVGRGQKIQLTPVAQFSQDNSIPILQPDSLKDSQTFAQIQDFAPDFIVVAAYGKIIPQKILDIPKIECLNVHASLLPRYRGAAPIHYALLNNDSETGVSIMRVIFKLDAGPVFLTKALSIQPQDTILSLTNKLADLGGKAIIEAMNAILESSPTPKEQDESQVTYASKITKDMAQIDWNKSAQDIFCLIRALSAWPVAITKLNGLVCKIYTSEVLSTQSNEANGTIIHISKSGWTVSTQTHDILIKEVQLQNKKRMSAFDLANGLRLQPGVILGR